MIASKNIGFGDATSNAHVINTCIDCHNRSSRVSSALVVGKTELLSAPPIPIVKKSFGPKLASNLSALNHSISLNSPTFFILGLQKKETEENLDESLICLSIDKRGFYKSGINKDVLLEEKKSHKNLSERGTSIPRSILMNNEVKKLYSPSPYLERNKKVTFSEDISVVEIEKRANKIKSINKSKLLLYGNTLHKYSPKEINHRGLNLKILDDRG